MKCAAHPEIETNLSCGKCGKPICPKCLVITPVGARCRECAGLRRLPTYQIPAIYYLRGLVAGVSASFAIGFLWYLAIALLPFAGIFNIIIAAGAGYGAGTAISRAVNKKGGRGLALIGGTSFVLSYVIHLALLEFGLSSLPFFFTSFSGFYQILALLAGVFMAVSQLK